MHTVKTCGQLHILSCVLSALSLQFARRSVVLVVCFLSSHDFISIHWVVCSFRLIQPFRGFWLRCFFCAVPVQVSFYLLCRALVHTFCFRGHLSDLSARSLPGLDQPMLNLTAKPSQSSNRT